MLRAVEAETAVTAVFPAAFPAPEGLFIRSFELLRKSFINSAKMNRMEMKFVKISQTEIGNIRTLYEGVMANASHGLFYREGILTGTEIVRIARDEDGDLLQTASRLLIARGWAEKVEFSDSGVVVQGSIEAGNANEPTCHRLRGVFKRLFEAASHKKVLCEEENCESCGSPNCVFKIVNLEDGSDV